MELSVRQKWDEFAKYETDEWDGIQKSAKKAEFTNDLSVYKTW